MAWIDRKINENGEKISLDKLCIYRIRKSEICWFGALRANFENIKPMAAFL